MNPRQAHAFLASLGLASAEEPQDAEPAPEEAVDFDGGVREPAPLESENPEADHNDFIIEALRKHPGSGAAW